MYVLDVIFVSLLVKDYQSNVTTALKVIDFENKKINYVKIFII